MSTITHCPCIFAFSRIDHMITLSLTLSALSRSFPAFGWFNYRVTCYRHFRIISARLPHLTDSPCIPTYCQAFFMPLSKVFRQHHTPPQKISIHYSFAETTECRYWDNVSTASLQPTILVLIRHITWSQVRHSKWGWAILHPEVSWRLPLKKCPKTTPLQRQQLVYTFA